MQTLNEKLRLLRKNYLHLTQNELGKSINVTGFTISDIEKGKRKLTERNLCAICEKYNVNKNWFFSEISDPFIEEIENNNKFLNAIQNATNNNDIFLQSIVTAYDSLSDEGKGYIYDFIKNIYENISEDKSLNNELSLTSEPEEIPPERYYKSAFEMTEDEINKEVEDYRQQLLLEKKQAEKSSASQKQEENFREMA